MTGIENAMEKLQGHGGGKRPAITVVSPGFLGNALVRFMAVYNTARWIGDCTISNFQFPQWNIRLPLANTKEYKRVVLIDRDEDFDIALLRRHIEEEPSVNFLVRSYLQKQHLFGEPDIFREMMPINLSDAYECAEDELLINIRAGDMLAGHVPFYPLTPVGFYEDLVRLTKLRPVFMGQLEPGPYVGALRAAFPEAKFIPSRGAIADFDTIRIARNIVPAVSTFSVVAAWLSKAQTIYLPLNGFLNPSQMRGSDLVPLNDIRYRYFLFPIHYALPESEALAHHASLKGLWREISGSQVAVLKRSAPFIRSPTETTGASLRPNFDERWYVHAHADAACAISDGWYEDGWHHYIDFGRARGYAPCHGFHYAPFPNIALGRQARQSSLSVWSKGRTITEDAMMAVNGDNTKDYGFCTDREDRPWWAVDLGGSAEIREIRIYNRKGDRVLQERASPLVIQTSDDGKSWTEIARTQPGQFFGTEDSGVSPLVCSEINDIAARFIRIFIDKDSTFFHLAEVEIFGYPK